jgi:hypothetical protein
MNIKEEPRIKHIAIALRGVGLGGIHYEHTELILRVIDVYHQKGEGMDLRDIANLKSSHTKRWEQNESKS